MPAFAGKSKLKTFGFCWYYKFNIYHDYNDFIKLLQMFFGDFAMLMQKI